MGWPECVTYVGIAFALALGSLALALIAVGERAVREWGPPRWWSDRGEG